jgi:hypothetical protein
MTARLRLTALAAAFLAAPVQAQNLVSNGRFDANIAGWQQFGQIGQFGQAAHHPSDANGSSTSGSLEATNVIPDIVGSMFVVEQCVNVVVAASYTFRAKAFIPSGQVQSGSADLVLTRLAGANCSGATLSTTIVASSSQLDAWSTLTSPVTLPAGTASVLVRLVSRKTQTDGSFRVRFDDVFFGEACSLDAETLCVNGHRFGVRAGWQIRSGVSGAGRPIPLTSDTGYFWFFSPANVEAVVKVINGCGVNGRYWVFAGGLTDVKVDLTVTDFETGAVKTYTNPQGKAFQPIQDTSAFATCP